MVVRTWEIQLVLRLLAVSILSSHAVAKGSPLPLLGAIRWDAWHGDLSQVGLAVEACLSPPQYRHRAPWFSAFEGEKLSIRCHREGVMAQEVEYAGIGRIDYWAFVTYPEDHPLSIPLQQYLAGQWNTPRFCNIVEWNRFGTPGDHSPMVARLVGYFADPRYVRVLGDRPLLYLLCHDHESVERAWGDTAAFAQVIAELRSGSLEAGCGDPYVVVMWFDARWSANTRQRIGADAISVYAVPGGTPEGSSFAESQAQALAYWESQAAEGAMIPLASLGWDPRPRVDRPVPWVQDPSPNHYELFTPGQCAEAILSAMRWAQTHPEACPAQTVLCYAWNEHDEGGWLSPTLSAWGTPYAARIEAVGRALTELAEGH